MATALEQVCGVLKITHAITREAIAEQIIELARRGERDPTKLRDQVLEQLNDAPRNWG